LRTLDNATVSVGDGGELKRLVIEAPTGEQFLVELSAEAAAALAAALTTPAPEPVAPQPPAPEVPADPEPPKQE
jgi:hypothetical protein